MQQLQPNGGGERIFPVPTARLRRHQGKSGAEVFAALGKLAVLPPKVVAHHVKQVALAAGQNTGDSLINRGTEPVERRRGFHRNVPPTPVSTSERGLLAAAL